MRMWRPKLKTALALLLFWQLGMGLLLVGPAMASVQTGVATSTDASQCHSHGTDGASPSAPIPGSPAHSHDSGAVDCCQSMSSCSCVCVQGAVTAPPMLSTTQIVTDGPAPTDLRSPPLLRQTGQVFRPPI